MEEILVYPKNEKQKLLIVSLLKEMKVRFKTNPDDDTSMTKEEFIKKIEKARKDQKIKVSPEEQAKLLGL